MSPINLTYLATTEMPALGYGPIVVLLAVATLSAIAIMLITHYLPKAKRQGVEKDSTYEAGMEVIGDARRRFNVKFYLVAMLFLIFDVELVFMYPWALAFIESKGGGAAAANAPVIFWGMMVFFVILTFGFIYEWGKGVLTYD